jgi:hypothetical protein
MNAETIVGKLSATIVAAMRDAPTTERLVDVGIDPSHVHAGETASPHCASRKLRDILTKAGITAE